jgi:hypothetical protein
VCEAPAVYYHQNTGEDLCQLCGVYRAGQQHGKAVVTRVFLTDAVAELLSINLTPEHVLATTDGELQGVRRPTVPDIAHPDDPRPWVGYLLQRIP